VRAELSPDGSKAVCTDSRGIISLVSTRGGVPEKLCERCGPTVLGWTADSRQVIMGGRKPMLLLLDTQSRKAATLLSHPEWDLHRGQLSPDGKWIAFNPKMGPTKSPIAVTAFRNGAGADRNEWIFLTDGEGDDASPMRAPDGNLIYFVTGRNEFQDPSGRCD
jgi:Tol biopolymer transport system component